MKYYMSVDGGGTKLAAVLFDDEFRLLGQGTGGAINPNFETMQNIKNTMEKCIDEIVAHRKGIDLDCVYISMPGPHDLFIELLNQHANVKEACVFNEGRMALLAGAQSLRGLVALAGTGSGIFWIDGEKSVHAGGWGSLLGDEGSGYYIGREGLAAAIKRYEGTGPQTMLYRLVMEEWQLQNLWDLVRMVYRSPSPRYVIASAAPLVSKAASMGDEVAQNIYRMAGEEMARQPIALLTRLGLKDKIIGVIAGGVWKGSKIMFDTFQEAVTEAFPNITIEVPMFEPVMGGVIKQVLKAGDEPFCKYLYAIKDEFKAFLYKAHWI